MFFFKKRPREDTGQFDSNLAMGLAAVVITVPAHGFIVNSSGIMNAAAAAPATVAAVTTEPSWMASFLGACGWAFMIAAGSLVYQHFVGKWQAKGLPILPMAAMAMPDNNQPRGGAAIPLPGSTIQPQQQRRSNQQQQAPQGQPSYLDQYEG